MVLFSITYKVHPHARPDAIAFFSSMTPQEIKKQLGQELTLVVSLHNAAEMTGLQIIDAPDAASIYKYCIPWTGTGWNTCEIQTVITENEMRASVLKMDTPPYVVPMDPDTPLNEGECLYLISWEPHPDKKGELFKAIGAMTEQENNEHKGCRKFASFFAAGGNKGWFVAAANSAQDLFAWTLPWLATAQIDIKPMVRHEEAQEVGKTMPGYEKNLAALKAKMEA
jgi:hypothetical protein